MTEHASLPPVSVAAPGRHPLRVPILVGAVVAGAAIVVLATRYRRPDPPAETGTPGMKVGSNAVTLAAGAPQWSVIKVAPAAAAAPHWSDPVPARIVFDDARASRLGSPLAGRVVAVAVQRGQRVAARRGALHDREPQPRRAAQRSGEGRDAAGDRAHNFERTQALVEGQSLPGKELVAAKQAVAEAELAVRLADQKLASLR